MPDAADADRAGFNRLRQAMDKVERLEQVGGEDGDRLSDWTDDPPLPPFMQDALAPLAPDTSLEEELTASLLANLTEGLPDNQDPPPVQDPDPLQQLERACSEAVCPGGGSAPAEDIQGDRADVSERPAGLHRHERPRSSRHETVHRQHSSTSILSVFVWIALPAALAGPFLVAKPKGVETAAPLAIVDEAIAKNAKSATKVAMVSGQFRVSVSQAQLRKTGRLDAAAPVKRRDPVQVASAVSSVPALSELSSERRADLQSRLESGECLSSALPEVLGHVPVLAMRDMIRLLEGDCL